MLFAPDVTQQLRVTPSSIRLQEESFTALITLPANAVKTSLSGTLQLSCVTKIHSVTELKSGGKK